MQYGRAMFDELCLVLVSAVSRLLRASKEGRLTASLLRALVAVAIAAGVPLPAEIVMLKSLLTFGFVVRISWLVGRKGGVH